VSYRERLAVSAVTAAMRLRSRHGRRPDQPVCPIDLARAENVDVRFEAIDTLEGMYTPDGPLIVLGSLRPRGRRSYTCAHELGHHVFDHGLRVDELLDAEPAVAHTDDAEYVADRFAAALLMPKVAVLHAFATRRWSIATSTPEQVFTIAGVLGVGYTTLITYLEGTLRELPAIAAHQLRKTTPRAIRTRLLGGDIATSLVILDAFWSGRCVDVDVGDAIMAPDETSLEGEAIERVHETLVRARSPGTAKIRRGDWSVDVRVARASFRGLAVYRHLEETDDDA